MHLGIMDCEYAAGDGRLMLSALDSSVFSPSYLRHMWDFTAKGLQKLIIN